MSEMLGVRDLRSLYDVVQTSRRDEPTEGMPWAALHGMLALVRCDCVSWYEADVARGQTLRLQWCEPGDRYLGAESDFDEGDFRWKCARQFAPCVHPYRTGDFTRVVRWSDCYTQVELRSTPMYAEFFGPAGYRSGMHASFPTLPGHMRKISFWRSSGPDFTERDRLAVQLLRPHLWEVYLDSQRRRGSVPHLSNREWEVLRLVNDGNSNSDIARRLFISVATVRKHLEHIFDRTGLRSRTAAAALMMPHDEAMP